jgi:hypothetical protein
MNTQLNTILSDAISQVKSKISEVNERIATASADVYKHALGLPSSNEFSLEQRIKGVATLKAMLVEYYVLLRELEGSTKETRRKGAGRPKGSKSKPGSLKPGPKTH